MWGWLRAIVEGLLQPLLQWWQTYDQGRNAEQAKSSAEAAKQASDISAAQAAATDITVDSEWLHRGSATGEAPVVPSPTDPPRPH